MRTIITLLIFLPLTTVAQSFLHGEAYRRLNMPLEIDSTFITESKELSKRLPESVFELFVNDEGKQYNHYEDPSTVKAYAVGQLNTTEGIGYMTLIEHQRNGSTYLLLTIQEENSDFFSYGGDLYIKDDYKGTCWTMMKSMDDITKYCTRDTTTNEFNFRWVNGILGRVIK